MPHTSSSSSFNPYQSAYRKHHSTETALLLVTDGLRKICATGRAAALVTLVLYFFFDTIDYDILIARLKSTTALLNSFSWFNFYLFKRKQFVEMGNLFSATISIDASVSQGSVFGFFYFFTYLTSEIILHMTCSSISSLTI